MLIDCDSCQVRGNACGDCMVTVLLGVPPLGVQVDADERAALAVLTAAGLVPPLRLVRAEDVGWSEADADTPIPYGLAYRHTYGHQPGGVYEQTYGQRYEPGYGDSTGYRSAVSRRADTG